MNFVILIKYCTVYIPNDSTFDHHRSNPKKKILFNGKNLNFGKKREQKIYIEIHIFGWTFVAYNVFLKKKRFGFKIFYFFSFF